MMNSVRTNKFAAIILACTSAGLLHLSHGLAADIMQNTAPPTSQPAVEAAPAKTIQELISDFRDTSKQLSEALPHGALTDAAQREKAGPEARPLLAKQMQLLNEMGATKKISPLQINELKMDNLALLYLLDDSATVTKVKEMADSKDAKQQLSGQSIQIISQWMEAGDDKTKTAKIADAVEKLDRANPNSTPLTQLTLHLSQMTTDRDTHTRLQTLVTEVMTDPYATKMKEQLAAQKVAEEKLNSFLNKPMELSEKTVDGKDFTTADWKGKVVLVDFWATWCGPCRAELPHVKEVYSKYHDKGLEVLGVSNDYSAKAVTDFTPANNMPWPQLLDADAAADHQWNPMTLNHGINGIPTMFLIDKKGVCRSITAREDMDDLIPKLLAE